MRSDEMIAEVRMRAFIPDAHPDYTSARILAELNSTLPTLFEQMIVQSRAGYYLDNVIGPTTAGRSRYRIPGRAITGGLEKVEIADSGGVMQPLTEATPYSAGQLEGNYLSPDRGTPCRYVIEGDQIKLLPAPDGVYSLKMRYYRRPGRLVSQQSSTLNSGVVRGQVTAVSTAARTVTVNTVPFDMEAVAGGVLTPAAITSAVQRLDIIHGDGWHECAITGVGQTLAGSVFTLTGTDDMSEIEVGDWVRATEQTDWSSLPDDFHYLHADATAIVILTSLNLGDKAASLAQKMGSDLQRFRGLLKPRVKDSPRIIRPTFGSRLHGRSGARFFP